MGRRADAGADEYGSRQQGGEGRCENGVEALDGHFEFLFENGWLEKNRLGLDNKSSDIVGRRANACANENGGGDDGGKSGCERVAKIFVRHVRFLWGLNWAFTAFLRRCKQLCTCRASFENMSFFNVLAFFYTLLQT
jgi:hypothetical protein